MLSSIGPFRIKQIESGNCWAAAENFYLKTSSACRDTFQLMDNSKLQNTDTSMNLHHDSVNFEAVFTSDGGHKFILQNGAIVEQNGKGNQKCYFEEDGKIKSTTSFPLPTTRVCGNEISSRVRILPGTLYITFFNIITSTY